MKNFNREQSRLNNSGTAAIVSKCVAASSRQQ